ncbi:MAG: dihydropteroate synthase, partial [Lachnospiraceae bacterium]|nr:dihydropteroate synthase [Lachnospiraceae bacterium]
MNIRGTEFDFSGTSYVMGILNVTPDSFSDGGLHNSTERAVEHALDMIKEGAAIIDIGGESTRPGYEGISAEEEQKRVIPVITALRNVSSVPISIDTTKPEVASAAIAAGADIINTVEGAGISDEMLDVVKETGA